ncbi:MAG TPA: flavodoxin/nitric oxide synthase [Intrasporangium sp.]|uniref:flavodoxin/nitric oxide synthase n=1 Tax=Intrasporangium sp. TaxID=1925024 RepID=UPI002D77E304|nr:flavodoxin/nitric oxide synthase [Intrasporangium sp.]HET7398181.1 flavodoxin/nitric oxide synthase [Intrasporangium sp.]
MSILIVVESMFGNTRSVAEAVAAGVAGQATGHHEKVEVVAVADAPRRIPDDVTVLLVGGPTHALSMSRAGTRADAVRQGATAPAATGLREWIAEVGPREDLPTVTFDTRVHVRLVPGSAAKSAAAALRHRGFRKATRGETFYVGDVAGPLDEGELERARAWGESLVGQLAGR